MTDRNISENDRRAQSRRELLLHLHNHLEQQLGLGETRAGLTLATLGAFAAAIAAAEAQAHFISRLTTSGKTLFVFACLMLLLAIACTLWSVRPARTVTLFGKLCVKPHDRCRRINLLAFHQIHSLDLDAYASKFLQANDRELDMDIMEQIIGKSRKAWQKFNELYLAVVLAIVSAIIMPVGLLVGLGLP